VLKKIEQRSKEDRTSPTMLYQSIFTMRHFRMAPDEWKRLSRIDRRVLHYQLVMENHYQATAYEKQKHEMDKKRKESEAKQRMMSKMPKLRPTIRRR